MNAILKTKPIAIHTWDWRAQPDWSFITSLFSGKYGKGMHIVEIETNCDEYAIVISKETLIYDEADKHYKAFMNDDSNEWIIT